MVTPVPIPNTEVKHFIGKYSYACHSETRKSPGNQELTFEFLFFTFFASVVVQFTR